MSARRVFSTTGDVAIQLLRLTAACSDVFPPLKSAAGGALHIAEIVKRFSSNKAEWRDLGRHVQDATASVVESIAQVDVWPMDTRNKLEKLHKSLADVSSEIESEQALPRYKRFARYLRDPDTIASMRKRVDDVVGLFQLSAAVTTMTNVRKLVDGLEASSRTISNIAKDTTTIVVKTAAIETKTTAISQNAALDRLQRVPGASWDSSRVCMVDTRVELVNTVLSWTDDISKANLADPMTGAKIMLLTAVAGAGKTTVAHTVARRCAEAKWLASSFFFDRETKGRNSPVALFNSIAADLSRLDQRLADRIVEAIEADRSLPLAPISTQFENLILKPCEGLPFSGPVVIVIDALDEAWDDTLVQILCDSAGNLPPAFRIFITSRMRPELDSLIRKVHVQRIELDIGADTNMEDMAMYATYKLQQLAHKRDLGTDWPGEDVKALFMKRAGGLFLWVATVCDYLHNREDPTEELRDLVSGTDMSTTSAEARMDRLYTTILESFDWTDKRFVESYGRVMGAAIASKTPLTVSALKELYYDKPLASDYTLQKLSPLLTGMSRSEHETQAVRVLHQSLRDFLVVRSASAPEHSRFQLDESKKSGELALLCLSIMNRDLGSDFPIAGYLSQITEREGVPKMNSGTCFRGVNIIGRLGCQT